MHLLNNIDCELSLGIKISLLLRMNLTFHLFAAAKSLLDSFTHSITKCASTPIIPYPATDYNAIFMTMINFKDVLKQNKHENGPLWSDDEGAYHTAKVIQLLYS